MKRKYIHHYNSLLYLKVLIEQYGISLLRLEEAKLLDLLSAVARKTGDAFEPQKERKKSVRSSIVKDRTGSIRPGITTMQRENNYSKNAIVELQAVLDQTIVDMTVLRDQKDREIEELKNEIQNMVIFYMWHFVLLIYY